MKGQEVARRRARRSVRTRFEQYGVGRRWLVSAPVARTGRAMVVALVAGAALAACGSSSSTNTSGTLPPVQVQASTPKSTNIGGVPGGPGSIGSGSLPGLPSNFPKSVTLPRGYVLVSSLASNQKTSSGWHLSLALPGTVSSVFASYKSQLVAAGYSVSITNTSATSEKLTASNSTWTVTAVGPEPAAVMTVGIPPGSVVVGLTIS